jgi:hypothetical protein
MVGFVWSVTQFHTRLTMKIIELLVRFSFDFYKIQFQPFLSKNDWINMMNTTNSLPVLKRTSIRVSLFKEETLLFWRNAIFREQIFNLVLFPIYLYGSMHATLRNPLNSVSMSSR